MRIAITGGRGLLGRAVTTAALAAGHEVLAIDQPDPGGTARPGPPTGVQDGLVDVPVDVTVDVTSFDDLLAAARGCDAIVHLAAFTSPHGRPDHVVHHNNVMASYNALSVGAALGIRRIVLASSINAIGGAYSRAPRYDAFPVDETHACYAEDPYSLSKWIAEAQAAAFIRRHADMTVTSLRFHALIADAAGRRALPSRDPDMSRRDLWGYTPLAAAAQACLNSLARSDTGHEILYVVAPDTAVDVPSLELAARYYPEVPVIGDLSGHRSFFDSSKATRLIGWAPQDGWRAATDRAAADIGPARP